MGMTLATMLLWAKGLAPRVRRWGILPPWCDLWLGGCPNHLVCGTAILLGTGW